jgi:nucleoside-diphosphate-sugar epimerase
MKILLLGGKGYIGSRLHPYLVWRDYDVTCYDLCWFGNSTMMPFVRKDFNNLSIEELTKYDAVILLAAHSSVKMCVDDYMSSFNNNIRNFVNLVHKIELIPKPIKLIYASSSSIYGNTGDRIATEEQKEFICVNNYDLTKYAIDQYMLNNNPIEPWYGLRFGTVNGFSRNFRSELMLNSMSMSAIENDVIRMSNSHIHRAILGLSDLLESIDAILQKGTSKNSGVYNINSFNSTVSNLAEEVAAITDVKIIDEGKVGNPYDFMISNKKFSDTFDFKFKSTVQSIVQEIKTQYGNVTFTNRDKSVRYE